MRKPRRGATPMGRKKRRVPKVLIVGVAILCFLVFLDSRIRPTVEAMAAYQAKVYATRTINDALLQELEGTEMSYEDIVSITQKEDGTVTSIQWDMMTINLLKAQMTQTIVENLEQQRQETVLIPLGTLLGNELLSGRGPLVEVQIIPTGYVQSEIHNQFTSAGINQTLHQINLSTSIQMVAILPGYTVRTETTTNFCIVETVIVGEIPDAITQIDGDNAPMISKINDYEAQAS